MQPVTPHKLAANAYRTLGLSATASQAAIESAARRMRIWPDSANIPPTEWDLIAWLGPVSRTRREIEQAVSTLTEPRTRVEERLLWYQGDRAPSADVMNNKPTAPIDISRQPANAHDIALAALHRAYRKDAAVNDPANWTRLMSGWGGLAKSADYLNWLAKVEGEGDFEKRASPDEIKAALATVMPAMTMALIPAAEAAMSRPNADPVALAALMRMAGSDDSATSPVENLLDNLEDTINMNCREMETELRDRLLTNHSNPVPYYSRNSDAALKAATFYNGTISPALKNFCDLAEGNEDRLVRAKSTCAEVLALLGMAWEWAGQFITAEQTLQMALDLAAHTGVESAVLKDLARVRPKADRQRINPRVALDYARPISKQKPIPVKQSSGGGRGAWILVAIVVGVLRVFMSGMSSSSSTPSYTPTYTPSYTPPAYTPPPTYRYGAGVNRQAGQRGLTEFQRLDALRRQNGITPLPAPNPSDDADPSTLNRPPHPLPPFGEASREH